MGSHCGTLHLRKGKNKCTFSDSKKLWQVPVQGVSLSQKNIQRSKKEKQSPNALFIYTIAVGRQGPPACDSYVFLEPVLLGVILLDYMLPVSCAPV
jgi:hypothetical protein